MPRPVGTPGDGGAVPRFPHRRRRAARLASLWPGVPVILAAPGPEMHAALHRQAIDRQLAVCADPAEALVLAHGAPAPPRLRESMQPSPGAARRGRDMVTEACLRWP